MSLNNKEKEKKKKRKQEEKEIGNQSLFIESNQEFQVYMRTKKSKENTNLSKVSDQRTLQERIDLLDRLNPQSDSDSSKEEEEGLNHLERKKKKNKKKDHNQLMAPKASGTLKNGVIEKNQTNVILKTLKKFQFVKYIVEFIGAFFIELFLVLISSKEDQSMRFVLSITYGFTWMIFVFLFQEISGSQFNPIISILIFLIRNDSFWNKSSSEGGSKKKIILTGSSKTSPLTNFFTQFCYILFQFIGTILGLFIGLLLIQKDLYSFTIPLPKNKEETTSITVFFVEMLIMIPFLLVFIFKHKTYQLFRPIYIGLVIFLISIVSFDLTGASLNPFRWLIPMLFVHHSSLDWYYAWAYLLAFLPSLLFVFQFYKIFE